MNVAGPCACGLNYVQGHGEDEAIHAEWHDEYTNGKPMPASVVALPAAVFAASADYRLAWIDSSVPKKIRGYAAQVAYVEARELNRPVCYDGSETAERPRLLVALSGSRAVGFIMMADSEFCWRLRWHPHRVEAVSKDRQPTHNPGIGRVWTAAGHRRRGLASTLIRHAAERIGVSPCRFIWTIPLTGGGEGLIRSLCPDVWLADGSWEDLHTILDATAD